jgi:hypothetical protein
MGRRRRGRSASEYFVAILGLAIIAFVAVLIATSGSCKVRVSPELGIEPANPPARPTAAP